MKVRYDNASIMYMVLCMAVSYLLFYKHWN